LSCWVSWIDDDYASDINASFLEISYLLLHIIGIERPVLCLV
jgi:hypothetical protein